MRRAFLVSQEQWAPKARTASPGSRACQGKMAIRGSRLVCVRLVWVWVEGSRCACLPSLCVCVCSCVCVYACIGSALINTHIHTYVLIARLTWPSFSSSHTPPSPFLSLPLPLPLPPSDTGPAWHHGAAGRFGGERQAGARGSSGAARSAGSSRSTRSTGSRGRRGLAGHGC